MSRTPDPATTTNGGGPHGSPPLVAVAVEGLSKAFPGTQALDGVGIEAHRGEVHALLGGNGSGKSTLIKALAGIQPADNGQIQIQNELLDARSMTPALAKLHGLHFVHQATSLFADLTVAENLMASDHGFETGRLGGIRWRATRGRADELLKKFRIDAEPDQLLGALRPASQTMLAVARALQDHDEARDGILVLDEPTSALAPQEVDLLLDALSGHAARGQTIIFVTHRLDEVVRVADRATILRDGRVVATLEKAELNHDRTFELIAGGAVEKQGKRSKAKPGPVTLIAKDITGGLVQAVNLELRQGEIVGLAGLLGAGRSSLLRLLFGDVQRERGSVRLDGRELRLSSPRDAVRAGIALIPEGRAVNALFSDLPVAVNLSAATVSRFFRRGRLSASSEAESARGLISKYDIVCADESMPIALLSGGNQQKAILARWLQLKPRVILLDEPTQGVDVHARAEIHSILRSAVDSGATALMATSDFDELDSVCDRILVVVEGRVVEELEPGDPRLFTYAYSVGDHARTGQRKPNKGSD